MVKFLQILKSIIYSKVDQFRLSYLLLNYLSYYLTYYYYLGYYLTYSSYLIYHLACNYYLAY